MVQVWLWKHFLIPSIAGFFFALGHFLVYYLSKTKYMKSFESFFIGNRSDTTQYVDSNSKRRAKGYELV